MQFSSEIIYKISPRKFANLGELAEASKNLTLLVPAVNQGEYNILTVLSHQVYKNRCLSDLTKGRVRKGIEILEKEIVDYAVMAGRDMHTGMDLPLAELMWEYAFSQGASREDKDREENIKMNIEPNGTDTQMQLLCFIRDHVMKRNFQKFLVVSDDYQLAGKAAAYASFFAGQDFEVGFAMSDSLSVFKDSTKREQAFKKQFSSLDLSTAMFREIGPGLKNHKSMIERIFSEHGRYKGQDPRGYIKNLP